MCVGQQQQRQQQQKHRRYNHSTNDDGSDDCGSSDCGSISIVNNNNVDEQSSFMIKTPTNKLTITRANSAKNSTKNSYNGNNSLSGNYRRSNLSSSGGGCSGGGGGRTSRKSSTIMFQEPHIIKRPNSTIGIPTSMVNFPEIS